MADSNTPNSDRLNNEVSIYRDAMRQYMERTLERKRGPEWIRALESRERSYDDLQRLLASGSSPHTLIDFARIPSLIKENRSVFPPLGEGDASVDLLHTIRRLRNLAQHPLHDGDCSRELVDAFSTLSIFMLEHYGLSGAAEDIRERERPEQERRVRQRRAQELSGRLSAGGRHNLGLDGDGTVVAWGDDMFRQCYDTPTRKGFIAVSAGRFHSLGLHEDGTVEAWGDDRFRQCSDAPPGGGFIAVSASGSYSLGLREDGTVEAWGDGESPWSWDHGAPLRGRYVAVSAGGRHHVGLREDGMVDNLLVATASYPNDAPPRGRFVAVSAGGRHYVGLREDGTVEAWGDDRFLQCSDAPTEGRFIAVSAGDEHSLALRGDGKVVAWGDIRPHRTRRIDLKNERFVAVSAGDYHNLGLRDDGTVVGWGPNRSGQSDAPSDLRIR